MKSACSEALTPTFKPFCWRTARVSQIQKSTKWWPAIFRISPRLLIGFTPESPQIFCWWLLGSCNGITGLLTSGTLMLSIRIVPKVGTKGAGGLEEGLRGSPCSNEGQLLIILWFLNQLVSLYFNSTTHYSISWGRQHFLCTVFCRI